MSFIDLKIELGKTNELLQRIATALERAVGPEFPSGEPGKQRKRGPESIMNYGNNDKIWLRENFTNLVHEKGLAPAEEQDLIDQAMRDFDQSVEEEAMGGSPEDL